MLTRFLILGTLALCGLCPAAFAQDRSSNGLVTGVGDGDTITARRGDPGAYEQVKVRLAGIDSP